jgi:hypothetical protein
VNEIASTTGLNRLAGEPLSGVAFVQDYVEFHYDGMILRSFTAASIILAGRRFTFPQQGSRDAFCSLIGRVVEKVEIKENNCIDIAFGKDAKLTIPLGLSARSGPEAAHFVPGENQPIEVW